jgi:hypothetical protein
LKDSTQNRLLVTYESYKKFQEEHFNAELEPAENLPIPDEKFREGFFKRFLILAVRIFQFTIRDFYALMFYIVEIIVLGAFGCTLFYNLDNDYIDTGKSPALEMEANMKKINNRIGSVMYLVCFTYVLVMSNTSYKMVRESKIIYKEMNCGLYLFPNYFAPKTVIDFIFLLVPVLLCVTPVSIKMVSESDLELFVASLSRFELILHSTGGFST